MDSNIKIQPEIYHFTIPLQKPIWIKGNKVAKRTGFILVLSLPDGNKGFGEISPLPGLHSETAYDAGNQLQSLCAKLPDYNQILTEFNNHTIFAAADLHPSVRFGCESAVIDLIAAHTHTDPSNILGNDNDNTVICVNGLVSREEDLKAELKTMTEAGYQTIKIKAGGKSLQNDIQHINDVCSTVPQEVRIRIDANQAWNLRQAEEFCNQTSGIHIEYIEEPLENPEDLPELFNRTAMPIALDESINLDSDMKYYASFCHALVLKPARLGSVLKTCLYMQKAGQHGIKSIISDTFQSGVGISMLANLAVLAESDKNAMGFDTLRWLKDDVLIYPLQIQQGLLNLAKINRLRHELKFETLDRII